MIRGLEELWLMNAAGMVKTVEDMEPLLRASLTHIVVGTITVEPRAGNPGDTFWCSPDGRFALNSRGLPNPGLAYYEQHGPMFARRAYVADKKLVVSITSTLSVLDWAKLASAASFFADIVEVNASCPNKWKDGVNAGLLADDPVKLIETLYIVRRELGPKIPLWLKLPPYKDPERNMTLREIVERTNRVLVDAYVSCNTLGGHAPPVVDGKPVISMPAAGMSGRALKAQSLLQNKVIGELVPDIQRIGIGGIYTGADLEEYRALGVAGVGIGTAFFEHMDPHVFGDLLQEVA